MTQNGTAQHLHQEQPIDLNVGAQVEVSLVWQAPETVPYHFTVFVHLLGEDGRLITQHDGWPAFGTRPTFTWEKGERILDKHRLMIPEGDPNWATLLVGKNDSVSGQRQQFFNGQNYVWLADDALVKPQIGD